MAKYDIIIVGGGTAGCAAAYTAGKSGLKTLLIEKKIHLGGAITSGLVVPAMKAGDNQINTDFFNALVAELKKLGGQITYQGNDGWFNPELTKIALDNLMQDAGVEVVFGATVEEVNLSPSPQPSPQRGEGMKHISSLKILSPYNCSLQNCRNILSEPIETRYVIDTTGDCEIGKLCGCEFWDCHSEPNRKQILRYAQNDVKGEESNINQYSHSPHPSPSRGEGAAPTHLFLGGEVALSQPVSLRFIMSNIDLKAFSEWILELDKDRSVTTAEYYLTRGCNAHSSQTTAPSPTEKSCRRGEHEIHLSTAYTWDSGKNWALKPLFDDAVEKGILKDADRNYFQIFTVAGMPDAVAFNCPRILEPESLTDAVQQGRQSILRISDFCKKYLKGFENAYISNIADELGVRVSNRIKGKYVYTVDDLKSGKKFENPVVISNYPVDVHSAKKDASTLEKVQDYQLPVESLMSADIENLFVAGRCLSADFMAQGALRVQPNCFAMGEGLVKYIRQL